MHKKKILLLALILVLAISGIATGAAFYVVAFSDLTGGSSGDLDAIECDDIRGNNTNIAITTGSMAIGTDASDNTYIYRYDALGEDAGNSPDIIVPVDRADCANKGQWDIVVVVDEMLGVPFPLTSGGTGTALGNGTSANLLQSDGDGTTSWTDTLTGFKLVFPYAPATDDTWSGPETTCLAGEAISQWELVYITHDTGTPECKLWDANDATIQDLEVFGIALEGIADTSTGRIGIGCGIMRDDGVGWTNNQDEGKAIYGSETPGAMVLTAPADSGDMVAKLGIVLDEDEAYLCFPPTRVEVP